MTITETFRFIILRFAFMASMCNVGYYSLAVRPKHVMSKGEKDEKIVIDVTDRRLKSKTQSQIYVV
jgi:hypothetical protein